MQKKGCSKFYRLDLGSGFIKREGFTSVDIDKDCMPDIVADIRTLKPIKSNSVDEIFTSHTLEHIFEKDLFRTLRTFYRVLKPRGILTIIVPDAEIAAKNWSEGIIGIKQFQWIILGSDPTVSKYQQHKTVFSGDKLHRFLRITGFTQVSITNNFDKFEILSTAIKPNGRNHATPKSTGRNRRH